MNNKTRIIIGVVIAVLFVIGIVALVQTQPINSSEPAKITNQNNTQIQNNSTDTIEMESPTIVKYALNTDKSSKVNTKSIITDKSSKVNTKPNDSAKNEVVPIIINGTQFGVKQLDIKQTDGKKDGAIQFNSSSDSPWFNCSFNDN